MTANAAPLEKHEQAAFVQWLELQGLLFSATAQSTFTTSWNQKRLNHTTGLRKGVPDMLVIISPEQSKDGERYILFIEMKRLKGGVVSKEQKHWIAAINDGDPTAAAYVCKGAAEAIKTISHYLKTVDNSIF